MAMDFGDSVLGWESVSLSVLSSVFPFPGGGDCFQLSEIFQIACILYAHISDSYYDDHYFFLTKQSQNTFNLLSYLFK